MQHSRSAEEADAAILAAIVRRTVPTFEPRKVILFGSRARGAATAESDYDLLFVMSYTGSRLRTAVEIRKSLRGLGIAKDIFVLTPDEFETHRELAGTVAYPAAHEGRVLYAS